MARLLCVSSIIIITIITIRLFGKATGHSDYYMINMGSQTVKIGSNLPLTNTYLQHWKCKFQEIKVKFLGGGIV